MPKVLTISKLIGELKRESSKWLKTHAAIRDAIVSIFVNIAIDKC